MWFAINSIQQGILSNKCVQNRTGYFVSRDEMGRESLIQSFSIGKTIANKW